MNRTSNNLPDWALGLLERLVPFRNRDVVVGDFAEIFHYIAEEEGRVPAVRWYLWQLMRSLPSFILNGMTIGGSMVGNYVKVASRNLAKRKFYAALNIGGLSIGMAVCLLIFQYVTFETSYDSYHDTPERIYRLNLETFQGSESLGKDAFTYYAIGDLISETIPEAELVTRIHPSFGSGTVQAVDSLASRVAYRESNIGFVEPSFFEVFKFNSTTGDPAAGIARRGTVVLTESMAQKYFGDGDPIGHILRVRAWIDREYEVAAVIQDPPTNSHLDFDIMLPFEDLVYTNTGQYAETDGWDWSNFVTYVRLIPDAKVTDVQAKIASAISDARSEQWASRQRSVKTELQPVGRIHLYSEFEDYFSASAAYKTVLFLSIIGVCVLIIAWVNYVNLTTARALERAREVGIRKSSGARRGQVINQFLLESMFVNAIALAIAMLLSRAALPYMNSLVGLSIPSTIWASKWIWIGIIGLFGAGSFLASLYPSFFLASYSPITVLKGQMGSRVGGRRLRTALVIFQFALSISLVSGMYIVYQQMHFLQGVDLGFSLDQTLVVRSPGIVDDAEAYPEARNAFKSTVAELSGVGGVSTSNTIPGAGFNLGTTFRREADAVTDAITVSATWVNYDFIHVYDFELLAGRNFSEEYPSDLETGVLINETGALMVGYESVEDAVGGNLIFGGSNPATIVGVLKDFNWMSAKEVQAPIILSLTPGGAYFSVKMATADMTGTIEQIEALFTAHFPGNSFDYFFADDNFNDLYEAEVRLQKLVGIFAGFALLVAALGLIGLAALTTSQRIKEISIRKVLGASDRAIARLLTGHFTILVALGVILAVPAIYIVADKWLNGYASRISLSPELFILPGLVVLLLALCSSGYHVLRASRSNPVEGIRTQ